MITIFNGNRKTLGSSSAATTYVQLQHTLLPYLRSFSATEWMVFTALAMHMDDKGFCFPSINNLAGITGLSIPTIRRAIEELQVITIEGSRVLSVRHRHDARGRQTSNGYVLFPDSVGEKSDGVEGINGYRGEGIKNDTLITLNKNHIEQESQVTVSKRSRTTGKRAVPKIPDAGDPGRMLYEAYRAAIFPELDPSEFTLGEWMGIKHIVYQMHSRGIDTMTIDRAARTLVSKWGGKRDIVTLHALWKHWSSAVTGTPIVQQEQPRKAGRSMQDVAESAMSIFRMVDGDSE